MQSDLELLRLARMSRDYDSETIDTLLLASRAWLEGQTLDLLPADTAFLVEALFRCGRLSQAALVAKKRHAQGEPATAFDDFAQQYQRLAAYDFALPSQAAEVPLFPPGAIGDRPRVLSLYHSCITFQTSGYTVRSQALLANSSLDVVPFTRIGYPWAAKIAKPTLAKVGKDAFSSTDGSVTYRHRRGLVNNQSLTFSNIALSKHEIIKAIGEVKPHLVHAASNFVNALPALLAARACGLPFVYEMRGLWELTAGVGVPGWLESERYLLERRVETFIAQNADGVIVLSDVQRRELIQRGVDERRIKVIINGHEPQRVAPGRSSALLAQHCPGLTDWVAGRTVIGYAGAVAVYEGLQDLIAAFANHRRLFSGVAVVIAGDGPYFHRLAAQVAALGLESSVRLLGRVSGEAADALYGIVDLCVLPRRPDLVSQLITPLKTVEILSHGKVLLASDVGAIAEQVQRYYFGETFAAGDTEDLARQLGRILADLPRLKSHYASATARIAEEFSWSVIARSWDSFLSEVATGPVSVRDFTPARSALAPLYDERPMRVLEPLPLWRRVARTSLLVESESAIHLRVSSALDGQVRLLAMPIAGEIGQAVVLGKPLTVDGITFRELQSLGPGRYSVFLYVAYDRAGAFAADSYGLVEGAVGHDALEELAPFKRESRQFLACELDHDSKSPTELEIVSEHRESVRVAASYVPLTGAELNANFVQRTKSKVTGTRFHYITVEPGASQLALFPRLSGRLMVELTPWGEGEILENRLRQIARIRYVPRDASLFVELDRSRVNLLIAANINETLLDGSTIWLKTLANVLAGVAGVNVYIVTNAIHVSNGVTAEVFDKPNVAKIDLLSSAGDRAADLARQVSVIDRSSGGFDMIIVRGLDLAKSLVDSTTRDRTAYYGAGMFNRSPDGTLLVDETALGVAAKCSAVIFQNVQMEAMFRERSAEYSGVCYCIAPSVDESTLARAALEPVSSDAEELVVYAGKLVRDYGVLELAQAVGQRLSLGKRTRLVVLGNKLDGRDPDYQLLLEAAFAALGEALTWLPAVSPTAALAWVMRADAVWGWRHGEFENSHFEISTKMVEAISCGAPVVLYPAPANLALMGASYAGFGEQATDAAAALERLLEGRRAGFAQISARLAPRFRAGVAYQPLLERVGALARQRRGRPVGSSTRALSVLVAGHDFRFFEGVEGRLLRDGHAVYRDYWKSHSTRYAYGQSGVADRADIIFCEWCLGNAVWWSNNLPPGKRLFIRLHLQELSTEHPAKVDFSRVEKVIFVSAHVMRQAIAKFGIPPAKCLVIPISVNLEPGAAYTPEEHRRRRLVLGMVGMTPWRKRPDRALELLGALRERYPELTLHLKGSTPSDYKWMSSRPEELTRYQVFFREVARLERAGVLRLSGYDDKLEAFYRGAGWVLSLSDFEGCHTAVAEGGVMGCLPLMTNWGGADEVYAPELVQPDLAGVIDYFDAHYERFEQDSVALQTKFRRTFGIAEVYKAWRELFFNERREEPRLASAALGLI